jgi:glycerol uptake operon antiterminator
MKNFIHSKVIAAVRNCEEFENAVKSKSEIIFHLSPDINTVAQIAEIAHSNGKKLFIHLDLAMGIGKDKSGIMYAKNVGVDGIITTRVNIVKIARECGLFTVQRFFIVDSHSVNTTVESVFASKADMIEIMPGTVTKVIKKLRRFVDVPVIAGGLIDTDNEIKDVIANGAAAVSTSNQELWDL